MTDDRATHGMLSTGWEPDVPVGDTLARRSVFADADRLAAMAARTGGRSVDVDGARLTDARLTDLGSPFGYDNAVVLTRPAVPEAWPTLLAEARAFFPPGPRRGFGAALTVAAIGVAPDLPALLISSDDGHRVHQQLGFLDLFRTTMWEQPPSS